MIVKSSRFSPFADPDDPLVLVASTELTGITPEENRASKGFPGFPGKISENYYCWPNISASYIDASQPLISELPHGFFPFANPYDPLVLVASTELTGIMPEENRPSNAHLPIEAQILCDNLYF